MGSLGKIQDELLTIRVLDTHEHIYPYRMMLARKPDIFEVLKGSYVSWVARMPRKGDFEGLAESLCRIKGNAFLRSCMRAIKEIYGVSIDKLDEASLKKASEKIAKAYLDENWQRTVLREKAGIDRCILDPYWDVWIEDYDRECFVLALRINMFLFGYNREARDHNGNTPYVLAEKLGFHIDSFDDYLEFVDFTLRKAKEQGYVCLKSALAYDRDLRFDHVEEETARRVFGKGEKELSEGEKRAFGDFVMHYILSRAEEYGFPVQFHTGLALIEGSNPMNLVNLFRRFPGVKFVLFHGGYPWTSETAALALSFPNVYVDLCWLPIISPTASRELLRELIETTGGQKIMWGGDCWVVEGTYGALLSMKSVLARVLAEYVEEGYMSLGDAVDVGERILRLNAEELFRI